MRIQPLGATIEMHGVLRLPGRIAAAHSADNILVTGGVAPDGGANPNVREATAARNVQTNSKDSHCHNRGE